MTKAWADTGYRTKAIDHGARLGIDVEVIQRDPGVKGFKVIPRRWVVEWTFGWPMHHGWSTLGRDRSGSPRYTRTGDGWTRRWTISGAVMPGRTSTASRGCNWRARSRDGSGLPPCLAAALQGLPQGATNLVNDAALPTP